MEAGGSGLDIMATKRSAGAIEFDAKKPRRWYGETEAKTEAKTPKPMKLRKSLTAGTVLILLSGRFRGRRVVYLKQLSSGCLLVTGPYKINGVPLRRANHAYVIATSQKVDVSGVSVADIDDEFFKDSSIDRKEKQRSVDSSLVSVIGADELLSGYLKDKFSLSNGQYPHAMKF